MSSMYEGAETGRLNYSLPGISSKRIFRRVAIRLNLSKVSGRWNETQNTEWPYPSTYVRRQMPEKYISGCRSADYCHVEAVVESNQLIQEYREDFFAIGYDPGVPASSRSTLGISNIEGDDLHSTEEEKAVLTEEEGVEGFQTPHNTTSATDSRKRITKIEEVETDDEDREILTNKRKRTPTITHDGLENPTSDAVRTTRFQDLHLQYLPIHDIFITDKALERWDHSLTCILHKLFPAASPIIAIQGSPELDVLPRRYGSAALMDEGQYQLQENQNAAFYVQFQDQTRGLHSLFHHPIFNFEEASLQAHLFHEFNHLQTLQNTSHARLLRSHDNKKPEIEDLDQEWIYARDRFPPQVVMQNQEQFFVDKVKKLQSYQLGLQQFIHDQLSLGGEGAPFTTYGRRLLHLADHDNKVHWEDVLPERAGGFSHVALRRAITALQAFGISTLELERFEQVSLALKEDDLA